MDHGTEEDDEEEDEADLSSVTLTGNWNLYRICQTAVTRKMLTENRDEMAHNSISEWTRLVRGQENPSVTDAFLFFILRFSSSEGDKTKLDALLSRQRVAQKLSSHSVVGNYIKVMSPLTLGFDLLPTGQSAFTFEQRLKTSGSLMVHYPHYGSLQEIQPDLAPFIARLMFHAADIADANQISILQEMSIYPDLIFLPGIDNHPYLASFNLEGFRWFICSCGTANCVGNCGHPILESVCVNCKVRLSNGYPNSRPGVRRATITDFAPPKGFFTSKTPSSSPALSIRGKTPVVTRFSLLLTSLSLMKFALDPRVAEEHVVQLLKTLNEGQPPGQDRRSLIRLLSGHVVVHLDVFVQLLVTSRRLTKPDQFRVAHLLLHKMMDFKHASIVTQPDRLQNSPDVRDEFENALAILVNNHGHIEDELDRITEQLDESSLAFRNCLLHNEKSYWAYAPRVFADRRSVKLELARNVNLGQSLPFLSLLMDDDWANKLDALQFLGRLEMNILLRISVFNNVFFLKTGDAMRFTALIRNLLQNRITKEEALKMSIGQGLDRLVELSSHKIVMLDRGRPVTSAKEIRKLFDGLKQLWDRFSQILNSDHKTFLDYFECQEVMFCNKHRVYQTLKFCFTTELGEHQRATENRVG